jgi:hypothetical protein
MPTNTSEQMMDFQGVLHQAAEAYRENTDRPTPAKVVEALLQAEKVAKQTRSQISAPELLGEWRLCFIADRAARLGSDRGKGRYVPKFLPAASISFMPTSDSTTSDREEIVEPDPDHSVQGTLGAIANQIQFGSFKFRLSGPFYYPNKKNLLAFDFTQMQLILLNRSLYSGGFRSGKSSDIPFAQQAIAKLPFFAFFAVTPKFIAARGRGGGLALWICENE